MGIRANGNIPGISCNWSLNGIPFARERTVFPTSSRAAHGSAYRSRSDAGFPLAGFCLGHGKLKFTSAGGPRCRGSGGKLKILGVFSGFFN